jgi:transposase
MAAGNLFGADAGPFSGASGSSSRASKLPNAGKPRLVRANRHQLRLESRSLDQLIPPDHRARALWLASEKLDLSAFYGEIDAVEGGPGRPAIDPRILLVLWLYAISEGVGSARRLARLCMEHDAYRWITGGLEICHRVLSDFRVRHGDKLDQLLTDLLAALMNAGVVTLRIVAQDGTRVRASAGAASFRREKSLKKCLREAKQQVEDLKAALDDEDATTDKGKRAAKERAARQREESVAKALEALKEVEESRRRNGKKSEPRASTTDPDARVMKMADGGFRPAYNCQLATDVDSRLIVASRASNSGGDMGQVEPTLEEIQRRLGAKPESYLVDGGYAKRESIDHLTEEAITVYAPPQHNPKLRDPSKPRQRVDSPQVAAWKERMQTDEAKEIYKLRGSTIETVNGDLKDHRGLARFRVRGLQRVQSVLTLAVLTYNLLRAIVIAPALMLSSTA